MAPRPGPSPAPAPAPHAPIPRGLLTPSVPPVGPTSAPPTPATTGISELMRSRLFQICLSLGLVLAGGGAAVSYYNGQKHNAAMEKEAVRLYEETNRLPNTVINVPGTVFKKGNTIEFKPDANELVIDSTGTPTKIAGVTVETRQVGDLRGIPTVTFTLSNGKTAVYQLAPVAAGLTDADGVGTHVVLMGYLMQ